MSYLAQTVILYFCRTAKEVALHGSWRSYCAKLCKTEHSCNWKRNNTKSWYNLCVSFLRRRPINLLCIGSILSDNLWGICCCSLSHKFESQHSVFFDMRAAKFCRFTILILVVLFFFSVIVFSCTKIQIYPQPFFLHVHDKTDCRSSIVAPFGLFFFFFFFFSFFSFFSFFLFFLLFSSSSSSFCFAFYFSSYSSCSSSCSSSSFFLLVLVFLFKRRCW